MRIKIGRIRFHLTRKEIARLTVIPTLACVLLLFYVNQKPLYKIKSTITPSNPQIENMRRGALKNHNRSSRRVIRFHFRQQQQHSAMSYHAKIAILKSHQFIESFINEYTLKPTLFPKRWDKLNKRWKKPESGFLNIIKSNIRKAIRLLSGNKTKLRKSTLEPSMARAVRFLLKKLVVRIQKTSGFVNVSLIWRDAGEGAHIVNNITDFANIYIAQEKHKKTQLMIGRMDEMVSKEAYFTVRKTLQNKIENLKGSLILNNTNLNSAFEVIDPAWAPETQYFKVPKMRLILLFLISFAMTFLGIARRHYKEVSPS